MNILQEAATSILDQWKTKKAVNVRTSTNTSSFLQYKHQNTKLANLFLSLMPATVSSRYAHWYLHSCPFLQINPNRYAGAGHPGRLGTTNYVFTVETQQPVGARNTSCKQLLWTPRDPSMEGAPIYLVTFETLRPRGQGKVHVSSCCGTFAIRAGKAHPFTQLPLKTRDPYGQGTVHVRSYCGSPAIRAGKAHAFSYFSLKSRDVSRQGTLIYVGTAETWLMNMPVYYNFVVVPAVMVKTRIMCMYVFYTVVWVPGEPLRS
jgi:hypothetical protein